METFKCNKCSLSFSNKQILERHQNKKKECNIVTKFKCQKCGKYFAQKKNLTKHNETTNCLKNIDSSKPINNKNELALLEILNSDMKIESKIKLIKIINVNLTDENIVEILNNNISVDTKIILLNTQNTPTNITNNTINYNFNNFGNENIEYLNDNFLTKLINNNFGESIFLQLSNEIYLNEVHPENQTIKIDNLNNKFCKIKENNKWITTCKDTALKKIFDKVSSIVESCLHDNKDSIPEQKINIINGYIEKDFKDELVVEAVKKLAFNIYNFYNSII